MKFHKTLMAFKTPKIWRLYCLNLLLARQEKEHFKHLYFWRFKHQNRRLTFMKWTPLKNMLEK